MKTVKTLISIGFKLEAVTHLPVSREMNCFIEYEIKLSKSVLHEEDERITLNINSFKSLDKELKALKG